MKDTLIDLLAQRPGIVWKEHVTERSIAILAIHRNRHAQQGHDVRMTDCSMYPSFMSTGFQDFGIATTNALECVAVDYLRATRVLRVRGFKHKTESSLGNLSTQTNFASSVQQNHRPRVTQKHAVEKRHKPMPSSDKASNHVGVDSTGNSRKATIRMPSMSRETSAHAQRRNV
jgi:hypothetical protein